MLSRRSRWILVLCVHAAAIAIAHWRLTRLQEPRVFWDSSAYLEEAQQPFSLNQFFYPKSIFTSLVFRVIGTDTDRIVAFQQWASVLSWLCFTAVLASSMITTRARVLALLAGAIFTLDPYRLGYGAAILSESINDSLLGLLTACLVLLSSRDRLPSRTLWLAGTTVLAACWMLTRDTNAVVALVGLGGGLLLWRPSPRAHVRELLACGVAAGVAVFVLWSTNVRPGTTHLTFQGDWPAEFRARTTYSMMNNLFDRVLPDREATQFFVDHGLPQRDALASLQDRERIITEPAFGPARTWVSTEARRVWFLWLLSTPKARLQDQWNHASQLMGIANDEHLLYMPQGWGKRGLFPRIRRLTSTRAVLVFLVLALPAFVYLARRHRLIPMILPMIVGGWVGSLAALYGDSAEVGRHCYGSGQQIILGLVMALVVCVDIGRRSSGPWVSDPPPWAPRGSPCVPRAPRGSSASPP